jgi:RNA polymerase sigma factor (sigma-70 family)
MDPLTGTKNVEGLIDHFFRHEAGKLTAVLTRIFGAHNLELAEDVVQDSLLEALNVWNYKGLPGNPTAWLYRVAKNKALNIVNREKYKREYVSEVAHFLRSEWTANAALDNLFSDEQMEDDQLRMMFTCCQPAISSDSQIALTLKTLCGFSIPEIARAFLTSEDTINKRLVRARQKIRDNKIAFEVPHGVEANERLDTVLQTIYLLFNEGYSASTGLELIRYEFCFEAIRLAEIISGSRLINEKSDVYALLGLMYLNASRFTARQNERGEICTLAEQNRKLWDKQLMQKGFNKLDQASNAKQLSNYHILAAISACHCAAPDFESTNWQAILLLYDKLTELDGSPLVKLNRAVALSKATGLIEAIAELENIKNSTTLKDYHLMYSTLGDFYLQNGDTERAKDNLHVALQLCSLPVEKELLKRKLDQCGIR